MSELGHCLLKLKDSGSAIRLAQDARLLAGRHDPGEAWRRKLDLVRVLLQAGQQSAALDCLASDPTRPVAPAERALEGLLWADAHLAVGDRGEASAQLARVGAIVREHSLTRFLSDHDRLAASL
jgi:hypothetical protein